METISVMINGNVFEVAEIVEAPKTQEERNERLQRVLDHIQHNPDQWKQSAWHCGTSHCFAGFAQLLARGIGFAVVFDRNDMPIDEEGEAVSPKRDARNWLGLTGLEAERLFLSDNDLGDLQALVTEFIDAPYDREKIGTWS
jgi:hypothetical protein